MWLATFSPSGKQVSGKSISKYVSSVRGWYKRFYRARLGLGAEGSRIPDILKGCAREVGSTASPPRTDGLHASPPATRHACGVG